jgi:hypothetical protein
LCLRARGGSLKAGVEVCAVRRGAG